MNWETLLAFGDSITIGARTYLGYPEYAANLLSQATQKHWNAVNFAKSGITAIELNRMITAEFSNLQSQHPDLITLLIGTNDLKNGTSPQDFRIACEQILIKAKLICPSNNVLIFQIPVLQNGVKYPYSLSMNQQIPQFNTMLQQMALAFHCRYGSFQLTEKDFCDGVHLNEQGVQRAGEQLAQTILRERGLN
jgi:lysophospholipase L1-like esterase